MLTETQISEKRNAHEMDRREARRNRRAAYGSVPHSRGRRRPADTFEIKPIDGFRPPAQTKPGFLSRIFAWMAGRSHK